MTLLEKRIWGTIFFTYGQCRSIFAAEAGDHFHSPWLGFIGIE